MKKFFTDNFLVCLVGLAVAFFGWANNAQLQQISLKQDKAILQLQNEESQKFVAKADFDAVALSVADMKTDLAVIREKLTDQKRKQNELKSND
jgi:hypothetical protein